MAWEDRKRAYHEKGPETSFGTSEDLFSEEIWSAAFEAGEQRSEHRFERLSNRSAAVIAVWQATDRFAAANSLVASIAESSASVALPLRQTCFKYTRQERGSLVTALRDLDAGAPVVVSLVYEAGRMIGYALTGPPCEVSQESVVRILDVDTYSRRGAGLSTRISLEGEQFGVGVAHVALKRLLDEFAGPLVADATTESSRYVFKSLGFIHDDRQSNPCILRFSPSV